MNRDRPADGDRIDRGQALVVADGRDEVTVTKIFTPKGERLELRAADGDRCRLDAIELECLSWQDAALFEEVVEDAGGDAGSVLAPAPDDDPDPAVRVSNEYAEVTVGPVTTEDGAALHVASAPLHYANSIRPVALRAVIGREVGFFSDLLDQPYGPMVE